jgi:hypothetical protein
LVSNSGFFTGNTGQYQTNYNHRSHYTSNQRSSQYSNERYFGNFFPPGMSEEEQLRRATEESLYDSGNNQSYSYPTAPPYQSDTRPNHHNSPPYPTDDNFRHSSGPNQSYERQPNYDAETIRRLRLRHYQS